VCTNLPHDGNDGTVIPLLLSFLYHAPSIFDTLCVKQKVPAPFIDKAKRVKGGDGGRQVARRGNEWGVKINESKLWLYCIVRLLQSQWISILVVKLNEKRDCDTQHPACSFAHQRPGVFPETLMALSVKEDGVLLILL
jgi:hypothetical protein